MAWAELDSPANAGASASGASISVSRTYTGGERAVVWVTVSIKHYPYDDGYHCIPPWFPTWIPL